MERAEGTPLVELKGHTDRVLCVAFSPDGTRIVSGSEDQTAKVWDARTGMLLLNLKGHTERILCVSFSPDETRIVTGSWDQTAKVWDARTGHGPARPERAPGPGVERGVQPGRHMDRHRQFGQDGEGVGRADGHAAARAEGPHREVTSVSFSPDGTRIVTGANDEAAKVWDARTGQELKGEPIPPAAAAGPAQPGRPLDRPPGRQPRRADPIATGCGGACRSLVADAAKYLALSGRLRGGDSRQ